MADLVSSLTSLITFSSTILKEGKGSFLDFLRPRPLFSPLFTVSADMIVLTFCSLLLLGQGDGPSSDCSGSPPPFAFCLFKFSSCMTVRIFSSFFYLLGCGYKTASISSVTPPFAFLFKFSVFMIVLVCSSVYLLWCRGGTGYCRPPNLFLKR